MDLTAFRQATDHHRHCPGTPQADDWTQYSRQLTAELRAVANPIRARAQTDRAWTVMLFREGLIPRDTAVALLRALGPSGDPDGSGELWLRRQVADEDVGSAINLGRTLQEPMSRLQLREKLLEVLRLTLATMQVVLDVAEQHVETVMAGQTHLSHAQPTTYAAYLLAMHDGLARSLELLELAYAHVNQNTAGCGALAGTGWPVDRELVTTLLGFDKTVDLVYDCEPGQDHAMTVLYAVNSLVTHLGRVATDYNIWGMEEVAMIKAPPEWCGVSSLMPQKAIPGSQFERIRIQGAAVAGEMLRGLMGVAKEPYEDMLPI